MSERVKRHKTRKRSGDYDTVITAIAQCVLVSVKAPRLAHSALDLLHMGCVLDCAVHTLSLECASNHVTLILSSQSKWHLVHKSVCVQSEQELILHCNQNLMVQ